MYTRDPLSLSLSERAFKAALAVLWFGVIPALLVAVVLRFAWPSPVAASSEWLRAAGAAPFAAGAVLFGLLALLARYWRFYLPGGRYLDALPPNLARRLTLNQLESLGTACRLQHAVRSELRRPSSALAKLNAEERARLQAHQVELSNAVESADLTAVSLAQASVSSLAEGALRARKLRNLLATGCVLLVAGGAARLMRERSVQLCRVLSASMLPGLEPGDFLVARRAAYSAEKLPKRGAIVVFRKRGEQGSDELIKRVIGLPGDVVSLPHGLPVINGWPMPHCDAGRYTELTPQGSTDGRLLVEFIDDQAYLAVYTAETRPAPEYEVKPGEVYVLGDNRNESLDSRYWNDGKPAGLPLADIDGDVTRMLSGVRRDQTPTLERFLQPLDLTVRIPGVDSTELQAGIERCLATRPAHAHPPELSGGMSQ
jgi:signal peptidase I